MQTWNMASSSSGGASSVIKKENVSADTTFNIPAGYTLVNCVARFLGSDMSAAIPEISMGTNVDADNIVPVQPAVVDKTEDNTITIGYSAKTLTTVTLKAQTWVGMGACSFYLTIHKYK